MNFNSIIFLYIIFSSFCFIQASSAKTSEKPKIITITHPGFKASELSGINIILKENKIDISSLIEGLEKGTQPYHDIFHIINTDLKKQIMEIYINPLCQKAKKPNICQQNTRQKLQSAINNLGKKLSDSILYPEGYKPIGSVSGYFMAAEIFLKRRCDDYVCNNEAISTALLNGTDEEYSQLYNRIKNRSNTCQKNTLKGIAKNLSKIKVPKRCLQAKNKNQAVCKAISQHIKTIQDRIFILTELTYGFDALKNSAVTFCLECLLLKEKGGDTHNFIDLLQHIEEQARCSILKPGQQKKVYANTDPDFNKSYDLKREIDGSYSVAFNLKFSAGDEDGYDGPVPKNQIPEYYTNKVQQCMDQANQKLIGPNGEKLKIIINKSEDSKKHTCPDSNTKNISINSKKFRSAPNAYASNIDCPTITHEILHLFGLCDDYKENKNGYYVNTFTGEIISPEKIKDKQAAISYQFTLAYDCRITKGNSIMSNHYERWDNVFEHKTNHSLVTTEQFNAILYGSCEAKNKLFNKCSQLAYQSSIKQPNCLKKKRECEEEKIKDTK